ncbi:MAG: glycine cleavage system protein GcvH [Dehalococcoidia bacterium]|nr:MAG: glycine cleavage system protein GcvH [Dehalococcoidia bacterium]
MYPSLLKYSTEHTWLKIDEDNRGTVGITHYYQEQLRNIVFIELPKVGAVICQDGVFGVIESSKATSDLYSPISGTVVKINRLLEKTPGTINNDPYGKGWMFVIDISDVDELDSLLSADEYADLIK